MIFLENGTLLVEIFSLLAQLSGKFPLIGASFNFLCHQALKILATSVVRFLQWSKQNCACIGKKGGSKPFNGSNHSMVLCFFPLSEPTKASRTCSVRNATLGRFVARAKAKRFSF
ncbi:hypothetical protein EUGRSUZ_D00433 [Eucalyptus grandis]|uniref:Uncharacterized protein n=2 Tax=Eucalyptus grandis TaxID=71139 RepID=A0ACC3L4T7_EUCGR|nr:hypothetical protein EUGRSUZ_D00433 [Eucalyptus grandis]